MSTSIATLAASPGIDAAVDVLPLDVLMPFHSITTTDSVERINDGLAKSPSEVLNPPISLPTYLYARSALSIAVSKRPTASSCDVHRVPARVSRQSTRHAAFGMEDGL